MIKTCEMTMSHWNGAFEDYYPCGRTAKFRTPGGKTGRRMNVCGIHRRSVDQMFKRIKSKNRCKSLRG